MMSPYRVIKCTCGDAICRSYQVTNVAPEAKFNLRQAEAVASILNVVDKIPEREEFGGVEDTLKRLVEFELASQFPDEGKNDEGRVPFAAIDAREIARVLLKQIGFIPMEPRQ